MKALSCSILVLSPTVWDQVESRRLCRIFEMSVGTLVVDIVPAADKHALAGQEEQSPEPDRHLGRCTSILQMVDWESGGSLALN
jgi:hypothetical protein